MIKRPKKIRFIVLPSELLKTMRWMASFISFRDILSFASTTKSWKKLNIRGSSIIQWKLLSYFYHMCKLVHSFLRETCWGTNHAFTFMLVPFKVRLLLIYTQENIVFINVKSSKKVYSRLRYCLWNVFSNASWLLLI